MPRTWSGRRLIVDLCTRTYEIEDIADGEMRPYLGGRGLNVRVLAGTLDPSVEPFDPDNPLVFGSGLLSGTFFPSSGRFNVSARSPLTGILGDSNSGGFWGPQLAFAGFDQIVLQGRSEAPVYLLVSGGGVEFRDAGRLWGRDVWETDSLIRRECGGGRLEIAAIGPAGERLVRFASIMNNLSRAAGRTGMGAVMGSKKVKALVVAESRPHKNIADPGLFEDMVNRTLRAIYDAPAYGKRSVYGTTLVTDSYQALGILPTYNGQNGQFDAIDGLRADAVLRYVERHKSCFVCPLHCSRFYRVREGRFAGESGEGPEYETIAAFGPRCGNPDLEWVLHVNGLLNRMGLDSISMGGVLSFLMECRQRGLIGPEFTDGIDLSWGNAQAMADLVRRTAFREGVGDLLAEGVKRLSEMIPGSERYAHHIKGLEPAEQDPRGLRAMGLAWAVASRGADHLRAYPVAEMLWTEQDALRMLGTRLGGSRFDYEGKANLVKWCEEVAAACDSLGLCKITQMALSVPLEYVAGAIRGLTGWDMGVEEMMRAGERLVNLERLLDSRYGISRADDRVPPRYATEPLAEGPSRGEVFSVERMIDDYYRLRRWTEDGTPSEAVVRDLGLEWAAGRGDPGASR